MKTHALRILSSVLLLSTIFCKVSFPESMDPPVRVGPVISPDVEKLDPNIELDKIVIEESAAIDKVAGFSTPVFKSKTIETQADEKHNIIVNFPKLAEYAEKASVTQLRQYLILILAHEKTHIIQALGYVDYSTRRNPEVSRLYETQADILAGKYLVEVQGEPTQAGNEGISDALRVVHVMGGRGAGMSNDHPSNEERRTAVRTGMAAGLITKMLKLPPKPELTAMVSTIADKIDMKPGEAVMPWSLKTAKKIIGFSHLAAKDIVLAKSDVKWNRSQDNPVVDYDFVYRNDGLRPIELDMEFQCTWVPKKNPGDTLQWQKWDVKNYRVKLEPGQQFAAKGRLVWGHVSEGAMPGINLSDFMPLLISPIRTENALISFSFADTPAFKVDVAELKAAVQSLSRNSAGGFKSHWIGAAQKIDGQKYYRCKTPLPGSEKTDVVIPDGAPAYVQGLFYRNADRAKAKRIFDELVGKMQAAYEDVPGSEELLPGKDLRSTVYRSQMLSKDGTHYRVLRIDGDERSDVYLRLYAPNDAVELVEEKEPPVRVEILPTEERQIQIAQDIVKNLRGQQYDQVRKNFAPGLLASLTTDYIASYWSAVVMKEGAFKEALPPMPTKRDGFDAIAIKCEMERNFILVTVVFDSNNNVNGLWVTPSY